MSKKNNPPIPFKIPTKGSWKPGLKISQDRPRSAKVGASKIPLPQQERIKQRFIAGQTVRQIAREEDRARETIDRIVKSQDMADFVREMRAKFVGLGEDALAAVTSSVRGGDAPLSYKILEAIGIVPSREETISIATQQLATQTDEEIECEKVMSRLIQATIHRHHVYRTRAPELDEAAEKVGHRINYETERFEPLDKKPDESK